MTRITSAEELLQKFRPIDRDDVQIPSDLKFPLAFKQYFSWLEPSGHRVYLVFEEGGESSTLGVVFERTPAPGDAPVGMCQWCHTVRPGGSIALLTAAVSKNHRVGIHLCSDLSCRDNVEASPSIHDLRESLSQQERMQKIRERMSEFAHRNLF